jgi:hypothetical protein
MGDDFDPEIVSSELALEASEKWKKGDISKKFRRPSPDTEP